jgi:hypothetical protein
MEQLTAFVSSRGILKSCDAHNKKPVSSRPEIDADLLANQRPGQTIYVCTDALINFSEKFLQDVQEPFVLVSGDSDVPITESALAHPHIQKILSNNFLVGWYAQNLAAAHPKVHHVPIGLDYHTMWERPGLWGMTAVSPLAQENSLINNLASSPDFGQRYLAAYCNWHFAMGRGDRQACFDQIDRSACFFESNAVPRNSTWLRQAECMFVISPEGAGMDCHRTWEAILLGCIPIMKRNHVTPLLDKLPAFIVEDWGQVTKSSMLEFAVTVGSQKFDFSSLFKAFWMNQLAGRNASFMEPMTLAEFRKLLTRQTG